MITRIFAGVVEDPELHVDIILCEVPLIRKEREHHSFMSFNTKGVSEHFYHLGMRRAFKGAHVPSSVVDLRRNSSYFVLIIYIIQIPLLIIFTTLDLNIHVRTS